MSGPIHFCSPAPPELLAVLQQDKEETALQALEQWLDGHPCPIRALGLIAELTCAICRTSADPTAVAAVGRETARLLLEAERGEPLQEAVQQWATLARAGPRFSEEVRRALLYLEAHYTSSRLRRKEVAQAARSSEAHLSQAFHREVGRTYEEYLTDLRIQEAQRLLAGTSLSVGEIASRVGYRSAESFLRAFKREVGMTPGRYRQKLTEGSRSL